MANQLKHFIRGIFFMYNWDYGVLLAFLLVLSVLFVVFQKLMPGKTVKRSIVFASFLIYVGLIIYSTLIDRESSPENSGYCVIPFASFFQFLKGNMDIMQQSIMNVALFYPFGFLLSGADVKFIGKRKWIIAALAFAFSFCVEILQFIFHLGYAEIDDVIHNTSGAIIGMLAFTALEKLFDKICAKLLNNRNLKITRRHRK